MTKNFMTCSPHQQLLDWSIEGGWDGRLL